MRRIIKPYKEIHIFNSLREVLDIRCPASATASQRYLFRRPFASTEDWRGQSWFGTEGGPKGVRKAVDVGWPEGVKRARKIIESVELPALPSFRRTRAWGHDGHSLNLSRVTNGASKPWRKMVKKASDRKSRREGNFTVIIDFGSSANVNNNEHTWRGVVGMRIVEALIKSGRRVRIVACFKSQVDRNKYVGAFIVKQYLEPIDYNQLMVPVALSGFLRTFGLACIASVSSFKMHCKGYGYPMHINVEEDLGELLDDSTPILVERVWNRASAHHVLSTLKEKLA